MTKFLKVDCSTDSRNSAHSETGIQYCLHVNGAPCGLRFPTIDLHILLRHGQSLSDLLAQILVHAVKAFVGYLPIYMGVYASVVRTGRLMLLLLCLAWHLPAGSMDTYTRGEPTSASKVL
jgi:hypothetical protein